MLAVHRQQRRAMGGDRVGIMVPAQTKHSLFASATVAPCRTAATVGAKPARPRQSPPSPGGRRRRRLDDAFRPAFRTRTGYGRRAPPIGQATTGVVSAIATTRAAKRRAGAARPATSRRAGRRRPRRHRVDGRPGPASVLPTEPVSPAASTCRGAMFGVSAMVKSPPRRAGCSPLSAPSTSARAARWLSTRSRRLTRQQRHRCLSHRDKADRRSRHPPWSGNIVPIRNTKQHGCSPLHKVI